VKGRAEFNQKANEILGFVDIYGVLRISHLEKFFPGSYKAVEHLLKSGRLCRVADELHVSADNTISLNKAMLAALSVLSDVFDKVKSHAKATQPAQISFLTWGGDYYEIVYAGNGTEANATACFTSPPSASHPIRYPDTAKRIVIIEDKNQMQRLRIPGTTRFALIQSDGSLVYFRGG